MSILHVVVPGEHLSGIAHHYGFETTAPIWDAPENAELRAIRNPNVLQADDTITIPDKALKEVERPTGKRYRFILERMPLRLALTIQHYDATPAQGESASIEVDKPVDVTLDGDGSLSIPIPPEATDGTLKVEGRTLAVAIGALDPVDSANGLDQRLANLGYLGGPLEDVEDRERKLAIEEFQFENGIPVTGLADDATRVKLRQVHGI